MKRKIILVSVTIVAFVLLFTGCHKETLGFYAGTEKDKNGFTHANFTLSTVLDFHEEDGKVVGTIQCSQSGYESYDSVYINGDIKSYMEEEAESWTKTLEEDSYKVEKMTALFKNEDYSVTYYPKTGEYTYEGFTE